MAERPEARGSKRPRLSVDIDPVTMSAVKAAALSRGLSLRDLAEQAFKGFVSPPFSFYDARPNQRVPLLDFLNEAQDIRFIGITLSSLQDQALFDFLQRKIVEEKAPMTFTMLDPSIEETSDVYHTVEARYRGVFTDGLKAELARTASRLDQLRQTGLANGVGIRILGIKQIPTCGMTICDPLKPSCKVRLGLYLHSFPSDPYPFIEINGSVPQGAEACNALLRYTHLLSQDAHVIDIPPPPPLGGHLRNAIVRPEGSNCPA